MFRYCLWSILKYQILRSLTKWWDDEVLHYLPRPTNEMRKLCCEIIGLQGDALEMVDPYHEYTRPFEYTVFEGYFEFKVNSKSNAICFIVLFVPY